MLPQAYSQARARRTQVSKRTGKALRKHSSDFYEGDQVPAATAADILNGEHDPLQGVN